MDVEQLSAIAGAVLSLAFSYVPGVKDWFEGLLSGQKQAIMGLLLLGTAGAVFGLSCGGVLDWVVCSKEGVLGLVDVLIAALLANQTAYLITKK